MPSIKTFWFFAQGIKRSAFVPIGTLAEITAHVEWVETSLNIEREKYLDNPVRWKYTQYKEIDNETLCEVAMVHNRWQRRIFYDFKEWFKNETVEGMEEITPADAEQFFPALTDITVPVERWSRDYYIDRMEVYYEAMRGREAEGINLGGKALTPPQASAVIWLFASILDDHEVCLEVAKGCDSLYSYGDYTHCEKCGARFADEVIGCGKRKCPLKDY